MTLRRALPSLAAVLALSPHGVANAQSTGSPASGARLIEIGQNRDGGLTYIAYGYAPASVAISSLGGVANGDFSFRVGGYCIDSSGVSLIPTGVSGNTTSWSYYVNGATVALVEDAPRGSCKYTARVTYALSVTGAVTINQMEYTVYLRGRAAPGASGGGLTVIP